MLVRGDNATGKSSIVQALSLALTGHLGTATDLPEEWQRHALESESKVTVELSPAGTIEVAGGEVTTLGAGQDFRAACISAKPFLRREEIINAIEADGCERFDYLEGFLGLEAADATAAALKPRVKQRAERVKDLERELQSHLDVVMSRLPDAPRVASLSDARKRSPRGPGRSASPFRQPSTGWSWRRLSLPGRNAAKAPRTPLGGPRRRE